MKKRVRQSSTKEPAEAERLPEPVVEQTPRMVRANVRREVTVAPGFVSLYTNDTQVQVTPWDIRMTFGEISAGPTVDEPVAQVKTTGEVRMSPQHAKKLAEILVKTIQSYENRIGKIPLPSD